jgi:hypothetical protein
MTVDESAASKEPSIDDLELATGKPGVRSTIKTRIGNGQRPEISDQGSKIQLTFDIQQHHEPDPQVGRMHRKY